MWKATCQHRPLEFVVYPALPDGVEQDGVLVYPDGGVTNRFADGTAGIGSESAMAAYLCKTAYCPVCGKAADWVRGHVGPVRR